MSAATTQAALTGLNKYTNYRITVFASTVKGEGNVSMPIIVITDEDSKYTNYFWVEILVVFVVFVLVINIYVYYLSIYYFFTKLKWLSQTFINKIQHCLRFVRNDYDIKERLSSSSRFYYYSLI